MICLVCGKLVAPSAYANFNVLSLGDDAGVHMDCATVGQLRDAREALARTYWPDPTVLARIGTRLERLTKTMRQEAVPIAQAARFERSGASREPASPYKLDLEFDDDDE